VIAGSAGGVLRQGEYVRVADDTDEPTHGRVLNTIGSAAGLRKSDGGPIDDFGSPDQDRTVLGELLA
jgi:hypothetical protein